MVNLYGRLRVGWLSESVVFVQRDAFGGVEYSHFCSVPVVRSVLSVSV